MRPEFSIISDWIEPGSRVLDLACGDGTLLAHLQSARNVTGYGLELDVDNIAACIEKGVSAIHTDLDKGLAEFSDQQFDYVIMTQALQVVLYPDQLLAEMLRVGRRSVVTFPNFGHWSTRLQLLMSGRMPRTKTLPSQWYNTQNIHLCTLKDFEDLCRHTQLSILRTSVTDDQHRGGLQNRWLPNLSGQIGMYMLTRKS
jgi:methionine biosynthesis protein MetW